MWKWHDYLAARQDLDYYLHVIGHYPGPLEDLENRSYVVRKLPLTERWSLSESSKPQVWIIRGWYHPSIILAAIFARSRGIPILMWMERPGLTYAATNLKQAIRILLRRLLLPVLFIPYRRGTIVLGTDKKAVEAFQKLSHGSPGYVFPYPNPVADACLTNVRAQERDSWPLLLFPGSFIHRKAVDLIVSACEGLWRSGCHFRIRYVGSGPLKGMIEDHVKQSGNRAELYPFADERTMLKHYGEADAVLLPSRFDGWGLVVHEGLASGIPVIVSDACGAADLITPSGCGKVVPAGNAEALAEAISWVVELTPQERESIRNKALEIANQLTVAKLTDLLLSYCDEALKLREQ
jgi:glycosyltransferase involved in cell wall biosynthesis